MRGETSRGSSASSKAMRALALGLAMVFSAASADTEKDRLLDKRIAEEFERGATWVADPMVTQYAGELSRKLAAHANLPYPLVVKVLKTEEARSVPLPGGFLYISSGLILRAESEAELAGILAHGIGHIALGPPRRQALGADTRATIAVIPMGADSGLCWRLATPSLVPASFRSNAQSLEEKADQLALQYLAAANYDPNGLPSMFDKLHTPIALIPPFVPDSVVSTAAFDRVKARLATQSARDRRSRSPVSAGGRARCCLAWTW